MANIPVNKDEIFYRLALSEVDHVGVKTAKKLINHFGSSQEVFNLSTRELMQVQGMVLHRAVSISTFAGWERVEKELNYAEDNNIEVVSFTEKN